jgi:Flp pilus assembly protein TadG
MMRRRERIGAGSDSRRERGTVTVIAVLALTALLLFAALAIDLGVAWFSWRESQNAASSAALAAAAAVIDQSTTPPTVNRPGAELAAQTYAGKYSTIGNPVVKLDIGAGDVQLGGWCPTQQPQPVFDTSIDTSDPNQVQAVKVDVRLDGAVNRSSPAFFATLMGLTGFQVKSSAVAYLGYAGSFQTGDFRLPLAINACAFPPADSCSKDFCATGVSLALDPSAPKPISCLSGLGLTSFDFDSDEILNLIHSGGNPIPLNVGDTISVQGGVIQPTVLTAIKGMVPPGGLVVRLPVVDCAGGASCSSSPRLLTGGVCFQIQHDALPQITGKVLCPDPGDPLFTQCQPTSSGSPLEPSGHNYGIRLTRAVLVQ